jgi:hypothetical protein
VAISETRAARQQAIAELTQEPTYAIGDRTRSYLSDDLRGKQHLLDHASPTITDLPTLAVL